ncbi:hypothetical protein D9M71_617390 [compost metagenome]
MPCRAAVFVLGSVIDEITFAKAASRCCSRSQRLGHESGDASFVAGEDFLALEIAPVGDHRERFHTHGFPRLRGHRTQLVTVDTVVGDFVRHDQVMLRIDRSLDVVANQAGAASHHRAGIWIGQGDLLVRGGLKLSPDISQFLHLGFKGGNLAVQALCLGLCHYGLLSVGGI